MSSKPEPSLKYYRRQTTLEGATAWTKSESTRFSNAMITPAPPVRIVLADDHQIVVQGLEHMLTIAPHIQVVGVAHDARESHSLLLEHEPDILLTDLNMPGLNGLEMIAQFRRDFPRLKIIVLSMYHDARIRKGLKEEGVAAYLLKSTTQRDLVQVITRVFEDKPVAMPQINHLDDTDYDADLGVEGNIRDQFISKFALGKRELEIFQLIASGLSSSDISKKLNISIETVHSHRKNIKYKTGLKNTAEITAFAVRNGII